MTYPKYDTTAKVTWQQTVILSVAKNLPYT